MQPIPLMVELCAGTAALSLRLHRDGAKPPVSRMGSKSGYASALLRILGLTPGQRAAAYLWCEPDPGVRLLLHAYRDAGLARAAAAIIRSWAAEDPRALWERLRAEGPPRLPEGEVEAGEVARWQVLGAWAFRKGEPESGFNAGYVDARPTTATEHGSLGRTAEHEARMTERMPTALPATIAPDARLIDPREVARWARIVTSNRLIPVHHDGVKWCNSAHNTAGAPTKGGLSFGGDDFCTPIEALADGFGASPALPATIAPDARTIDPYEVARFAQIVASNRLINTAWSDAEGRWINTGDGGATFGGATFCSPPERTAEGLDAAPSDLPAVVAPDAREVDPREVARWAFVQSSNTMIALDSNWRNTGVGGSTFYDRDDPRRCAPHIAAIEPMPALIHPDARDIDPPALPPGTVAYLDPPYENTTPYANLLPRAEVVALARRWAAAGATVAISEAEPIPELVAEGWYSVDITNQRAGQKRTFSKQQHEHVTMNRAPAWVPPVQGRLF